MTIDEPPLTPDEPPLTTDEPLPMPDEPQHPRNGLGIAGFVVSLVGVCSGGLLSPVGLIISIVALKRQPKGFAIAGIVIGALGSCGLILSLILIPLAVVGVLVAAGATAVAVALAALIGGPPLGAQVEMGILTGMVDRYEKEQGHLPPALDDALTSLDLNSRLRTDHWGNAYVYELSADGTSFKLHSMGADGQPGTSDDITYNGAFTFGFDARTPPPASTQSPQPPAGSPSDAPSQAPKDAPTPPADTPTGPQ